MVDAKRADYRAVLKRHPDFGPNLCASRILSGRGVTQVCAGFTDCGSTPGESSGQVDNLTRLRSRNHPLEVRILAAVAFEFAFPPFDRALNATLFLVRLFLPANSFSLALFHAVFLWQEG